MRKFTRFLLVCVLPWLLAGCGKIWPSEQSWPTDHEGIERHFAQHREGMAELAAAIEASEYVRVSIERDGRVFAEEYPGGRSRSRLLRGTEAEQWQRLFRDARVPFVFIDDLDIVNLYARHTIAGDKGFLWSVFYRLKPGYLYPAPQCSDDLREAPCGRCRVDLDESWTIFFEWLPEILDIEMFQEHVEGDMTLAEAMERRESVFKACAASKGRTFELPELR